MNALLACIHVGHEHARVHGGQRRASDFPELERSTVVGLIWTLEMEPRSSARAASTRNCWTSSLAPNWEILKRAQEMGHPQLWNSLKVFGLLWAPGNCPWAGSSWLQEWRGRFQLQDLKHGRPRALQFLSTGEQADVPSRGPGTWLLEAWVMYQMGWDPERRGMLKLWTSNIANTASPQRCQWEYTYICPF